MNAQERKSHWENVYAANSPEETSWYQRRPEVSLQLVAESGLGRGEPLIDVGGGASTLAGALLAEGYRDVTVLDVAEASLAAARARLGEAAGAVGWIASDVLAFHPSRRYRLWHDRAVFHFLATSGERSEYMDTVARSLEPGGALVVGAFALDGPERCSGLRVERYDAAKVKAAFGAGFELLKSVEETHVTPAGSEQKFAYFLMRRLGAVSP